MKRVPQGKTKEEITTRCQRYLSSSEALDKSKVKVKDALFDIDKIALIIIFNLGIIIL